MPMSFFKFIGLFYCKSIRDLFNNRPVNILKDLNVK